MKRSWDSLSRRLVHHNPQTFLNLFEIDARYIHSLPEELEILPLRMDNLLLTEIKGEETLVGLELRTRNNRKMNDRLLQYNVNARLQHQKPMISCVMNLLKGRSIPDVPHLWHAGTRHINSFYFLHTEVYHWRAEDLLRESALNLLPLLPLTNGGLDPSHVASMFERLLSQGNAELVDISAAFASLAFRVYQGNEAWLSRKIMDMQDLQEFPLYREAIDQGVEASRQEWLRSNCNLLVWFIETRRPRLSTLVREQIALMDRPEILPILIRKVIDARTLKEARYHLLNWQQLDQKERL